MRMRKLLLVLVTLGLCLFAEDKAAYVNMNEIFEQYYKTVNANILFEHKKKDYEEKMVMLSTDLENAVRDVKSAESEANNELLDAKVREEAVRKYKLRAELFQTKRGEFEKARQSGMAELQRIREETETTLVAELRQILEKFAANKGYVYVYDISGNSLNRLPFLLVYPKKLEVTKTFIAVINKGHETEVTNAKAKLAELRKKPEPAKSDSKKK